MTGPGSTARYKAQPCPQGHRARTDPGVTPRVPGAPTAGARQSGTRSHPRHHSAKASAAVPIVFPRPSATTVDSAGSSCLRIRRRSTAKERHSLRGTRPPTPTTPLRRWRPHTRPANVGYHTPEPFRGHAKSVERPCRKRLKNTAPLIPRVSRFSRRPSAKNPRKAAVDRA